MEPTTFSPLNYTILFIYLAAMLIIGLFFARRQHNTEDFFLGGRKMPWLAVGMSMYASLTSAVTFMALPGTACREFSRLIFSKSNCFPNGAGTTPCRIFYIPTGPTRSSGLHGGRRGATSLPKTHAIRKAETVRRRKHERLLHSAAPGEKRGV